MTHWDPSSHWLNNSTVSVWSRPFISAGHRYSLDHLSFVRWAQWNLVGCCDAPASLLCAGFGRKCAQFEKILSKHKDSIKRNENTTETEKRPIFSPNYFHEVLSKLPKQMNCHLELVSPRIRKCISESRKQRLKTPWGHKLEWMWSSTVATLGL